MIIIRPIQATEIPAAKQLIYGVAHQVFHDARPLEESIAFYEARGQLDDMDSYRTEYQNNHGTFLVMMEDDRIIGTGAVRKINDEICELKRLWLLFEYHGQGLGYRMMRELLAFARAQGYRRMRLETDQTHQNRAFKFYQRLGFCEIPRYSDNEDDVAMELVL